MYWRYVYWEDAKDPPEKNGLRHDDNEDAMEHGGDSRVRMKNRNDGKSVETRVAANLWFGDETSDPDV